jgi:hypothetical protein
MEETRKLAILLLAVGLGSESGPVNERGLQSERANRPTRP